MRLRHGNSDTPVRRISSAQKLPLPVMSDELGTRARASSAVYRDAGMACALVVFSLFSPLAAGFSAIDAALIACSIAAPFIRRRWPLATVAVCAIVLAASALATTLPTGAIGIAMLSAYVLTRHVRSPMRYLAAAVLFAGDVVATTFINPTLSALPLAQRAPYIAWSVTLLVVAFLTGELRRRAEETAAKEVRQQLERQREEFERAAAEQRAHLAREIHDIVTHSLTVIVAQADGARYGSSPDEALRTISTVGRESLRQMRGVVGLLRGPESRTVEPLVAELDIDSLIATSRAGGLDIEYEVRGAQPDVLDAGTTLTIHRIVQEALTNALKHGNGHAELAVDWRPHEVLLRVSNCFAPGSERSLHPGHGLHGMQERASLIDGSVTAAPSNNHTWVTEARLPLHRNDRVEP